MWRSITLEDLRDTQRILELFEEVISRGILESGGDYERLNFVAAAEHALTVGSTNPPGLFRRTVEQKRWNFITQADEDAAHQRLKKLEWGYVDGGGERSCSFDDAYNPHAVFS